MDVVLLKKKLVLTVCVCVCVCVFMCVCCLLCVQIEFLSAGYEEESIKRIVNNNMHLIVDRVLRV